MCLPDGSPNYAMVLRWSNHRARDHRNHVAPRRKPIPTSQRSQLTKTLLWTRNLFQNQTVFSPTFMCRSVGISRICRLKKFQNPTVHAYRSYRKESAYAVSEISRSGAIRRTTRTKTTSRWRLGEYISLSPFETGGRSRNQKQLPVTLRSHRGEKHARVFHRNRASLSVSSWGNIICLGLEKETQRSYFPLWKKNTWNGIPTLIRRPPAKRTHRYWSTACDRQRAETTRTFFFVEKARCHEYTYKRRPGVACSFRLAPMASCRGASCRCISLNGWSWLSFDGLFFQILSLRLTPFVHLSTEVGCCVSHSTVCSWLGVVWAMMFNRGILFYSKWPFGQSQHIKEKQSFSFVNSSSLDWVNMNRESSSKVHQRGARMPGQRRAGQLVFLYSWSDNPPRGSLLLTLKGKQTFQLIKINTIFFSNS